MSNRIVRTICFECHSRCGVLLEIENGKITFIGDGEVAIINVTLPLNTTYQLDIYSYSGPQKTTTRGSALEIIIDDQSTDNIVSFTAEEWNWEYLGTWQMQAGSHVIKLVNREGGELWDTNVYFTKVRILWLKE